MICLCSYQIVCMAEEFSVYDTEPIIDDRDLVLDGDMIVDSDELSPVYVLDPADYYDEFDYDGAIESVQVMSLNPITPEDSSGLKAVLLELIGNYDAVVVEYQYQNSNMTGYNYLREVQPDYVWLCSAGLFSLVIYCVFRLGGALIRD